MLKIRTNLRTKASSFTLRANQTLTRWVAASNSSIEINRTAWDGKPVPSIVLGSEVSNVRKSGITISAKCYTSEIHSHSMNLQRKVVEVQSRTCCLFCDYITRLGNENTVWIPSADSDFEENWIPTVFNFASPSRATYNQLIISKITRNWCRQNRLTEPVAFSEIKRDQREAARIWENSLCQFTKRVIACRITHPTRLAYGE